MSEFAKLIEVTREPRGVFLKVNGEEFPWHIAEGITSILVRDDMPGIQITLLADEVKIHDKAPGS